MSQDWFDRNVNLRPIGKKAEKSMKGLSQKEAKAVFYAP